MTATATSPATTARTLADVDPQLLERARDAAAPADGATRDTPLPVFRAIATQVTRRAAEEEGGAETISIALSSEQPVLRYDWWEDEYYYEVLDHSPSSVDLSYARDGMPFLMEHYRGDQRGICENVRVDGDRILRCDVRFSARQDGQDLKRDMLDGIRPKVSVYALLAREFTQEDAGEGTIPTRRYTKWMPVEGSSVSIPADYGVGVGRSAHEARPASPTPPAPQARSNTVKDKNTAANGAATDEGSVAVVADHTAERSRMRELNKLGAATRQKQETIDGWIDSGRSVEAIKAELFETAQRGAQPAAPAARVQLTDKEERQYSVARGIQALITGKRDAAGFEFEVSEECARQMKKDTAGFFMPTSIRGQSPSALADTPETRRALGFTADGVSSRATTLAVGTAGFGAEAKFTEYGGFIDLLRNRSALLKLGAQVLPGLQGDVSFVGQTSAGVAGWNAETVNAALVALGLGLRGMTPHGLQSASAYTRKLMLQAPFSIENLVRGDMAKLHALEIDRAGINGSGVGDEPKGILKTAGIGAVVGGANGAIPTFDNIVDLETEVAVDNADISTLGYLTNARMRGRLKKTPELNNAQGKGIWTGGKDGEVNGYSAFASGQVPGNLTKGTSVGNCSAIIHGAFGEMIIGEWGAMEVLVDALTMGPTVVKVMSIQFIDIFLRYVEAFAAMQDALAS